MRQKSNYLVCADRKSFRRHLQLFMVSGRCFILSNHEGVYILYVSCSKINGHNDLKQRLLCKSRNSLGQ